MYCAENDTVLVSILVPVYGVERFIKKCAISLFEQTYTNIEYIFVDDCSKDESMKILHEVISRYPTRAEKIKILVNSVNSGLAYSRKKALQASSGDYILHVDSDDYLEPYAISHLVDKALKSKADIVVYDIEHIYKTHSFIEHSKYSSDNANYLDLIMRRETSVNLVSKLYRRNVCLHEDALPIEGLNFSEDFAVLPRVVYYANNIEKLDEALYKYNHTNESSYMSNITRERIMNMSQAYTVIASFYQTKEDYSKYEESIRVGAVYNKGLMLILCHPDDIKYIQNKVTCPPDISMRRLSNKYKLIYFCIKHNLLFPIILYKTIRKIKYSA